MPKVKILPPETSAKIAAGEVIENPASVVKELLENSLDAESTAITIELKDAGKSLIKVKDNGTGIEKGDLETIFLRHATSKIRDITDLEHTYTLGFRGEALYSIAAVSEVSLKSTQDTSGSGWQIYLKAGEKLYLKPASLLKGTEVEIKNLFYNLPARRKFLKTSQAELRKIMRLIIPYTLAQPQISFEISNNQRKILTLIPAKDRIDRIKQVLNLPANNIISVPFREPEIQGELFLGDINIQRPRRDMQFLFINQRPVYNNIINFHLNQAYRMIMQEKIYPFFIAWLNIPAEYVDVNIHPAKYEVRLKNEQKITGLLRKLCEKALLSRSKIKKPHIRIKPASISRPLLMSKDYNSPTLEKYEQLSIQNSQSLFEASALYSHTEAHIQKALKEKLTSAFYIGQFAKKYLFFENPPSLIIMDQHAAHERVNYEAILRQAKDNLIEAQHCLTPQIISLSTEETIAWEEIKETLEKIGFSTTLWDKNTLAIHTYPRILKDPGHCLKNILSVEEPEKPKDLEQIAKRACRSSIMANQPLNPEQAKWLVRELLKCENPFACPHGRPTVIEIDIGFFEKEFLRR